MTPDCIWIIHFPHCSYCSSKKQNIKRSQVCIGIYNKNENIHKKMFVCVTIRIIWSWWLSIHIIILHKFLQNTNTINNYNITIYNTFLALGHCSIPVSYHIWCFSYNQSLSFINCIYIVSLIKLTSINIHCAFEFRAVTILIVSKHVWYMFDKNSFINSGMIESDAYAKALIKNNMHSISAIALSQLIFMYWPKRW